MLRVISVLSVVLGFLFSNSSQANEGIDAAINAVLSPISNKIAGTVFWSFLKQLKNAIFNNIFLF